MQALQQAYAELTRLGVRVAGVSTDSWATNADFTTHHGIEFPLLSDWPGYQAIRAFGVEAADGRSARRVTFVFYRDGEITSVVSQRDPQGHAVEVLSLVRAGAARAGATQARRR